MEGQSKGLEIVAFELNVFAATGTQMESFIVSASYISSASSIHGFTS